MFCIDVKQEGLREEFSQECEKEDVSKSSGPLLALTRLIDIYPRGCYHVRGRLSIGIYYTVRALCAGKVDSMECCRHVDGRVNSA